MPKYCPKCKSPYWNKERRTKVVHEKYVFDPSYRPSPEEIGDANEEILGYLHNRFLSSSDTGHTPYINVPTLVRRLTENNSDDNHTTLIKYNIERLILYKSVRLVSKGGVRSICHRDPYMASHAITKTEIKVFRDRINKFFKKEKKSGINIVGIEDVLRGVDVRELGGIRLEKSRRIYCIKTVLKIMVFEGELNSLSDGLYSICCKS